MNKTIKSIKNFKVSPAALVFVAVITVTIFGLQVSKIYASKLSNSLQVDGGTVITGSLSSGAPLRVGASNESHALNVGGVGDFSSVVYAPSGDADNWFSNSIMTVGAVDEAVNNYIVLHPRVACRHKRVKTSCAPLPPGQVYVPSQCDAGCVFSDVIYNSNDCTVTTLCVPIGTPL